MMTAKSKTMMMAMGCIMALTAMGRTFNIDLRAPASRSGGLAKAPMSQPASIEGTLRKVNLDVGAADIGAVEVGDELSFTLFDDVTIGLVLKENMPSPLGGDAFIAEVSGYDGIKNAVVLRTADGLTVDIQDYLNRKVYKVISTAAGVTVQEIAVTGGGKCGSCDALEPSDLNGAVGDGMGKSSAEHIDKVSTPAETCVDILVAFDVNAALWAKTSGGGTTNFAQTAVQKMNAALANTGLSSKFRFRLVGVTVLNVSASTVKDGLEAIKDNRAGWNAVKTARNAVGADIVTTLVDTGSAYGTTGVGQSLARGMSPSSFAENAYNVCSIRAVAITQTMTHECGHNMGAGHCDIQKSQPGPQLYTYSAGYYFDAGGESYCTIMAYDSENPNGKYSTQVPFFSSPSYAYEGTTVGDSTHNNTLTLSDTYAAAANWRAQKVPTSYDVVFEPASGTVVDGSLSVTLATGKSGTSIRYTLDGSNPTLSSPLYSGPITLTRTTTIKAISVTDGKASMPFEALYYTKNDIGYALGISGLTWSQSVPSTSTLRVQTEKTFDGVGLGAEVAEGDVCKFSTTIVGPATITWRSMWDGDYIVHVKCDGSEVYSDYTAGSSSDWSVEPQTADIPAGSHKVEFQLGESSYSYYYDKRGKYWLDDFHVHYLQKPTFNPATSDYVGTAVTFTGEKMVTLQPPSADCQIFYTVDGSDPNGKDAILYEGPFFINATTRVRAIAVQPGKGSSAIASGLYVERHAVKAGEWTLWGEGAYEAAKSGRMIAELNWSLLYCYWSQQLEPVITSEAFTSWAAANGIYLMAESWGDMQSTGSRFWEFYSGTDLEAEMEGWVAFPTFVFSSGSGTGLGAMLARNDDTHTVNGIYYRDTPESLINSFASILGAAAPLAAPVASVTDANGKTFPFSVTLSNPNGTGTIYYTLDGTAPTREKGTRYTGAISIPSSGTTLKAVVWPGSNSAVSSIPLAITYQPLAEMLGTDGVTWQNDATRPWIISKTASGSLFKGAKTPDNDATSTIKARVQGPGVVKFDYSIYTRGGSRFVFKVNGSEVESSNYAGNRGFAYRVESTGTTELSWTYQYASSDSSSEALYCEFKNFAWSPSTPPKTVGGLTASQGTYDYGTLLRWKAAANADSYAIYRGDANDASSAKLIGTTEKCQYWDTSAIPGWTYWYWVKAVNGYGESSFSSVVSGRRKGDSGGKVRVTLGKNGGTGGDSFVTAIVGQPMPTPRTAPKKDGYVFDGYWTSTGSGGVQYYDKDMKSVRNWDKTSETTLWAKWRTMSSSKVTFGKNGGTGGDDYVTATEGQPMPTPRTAPTKSGWTFAGYWDTLKADGKQYYDGSMKSVRNWDKKGTVTLWAKWTNRVTFGKNGGTGGDDYVTATEGQPMPMPRRYPEKKGWVFDGYWDTLKTGGKQYYDAEMKSVRNWDKSGAVTLWAKWHEAAAPMRVTFGKNEGTGGDAYVTATEGQPMPTPRTAPTKSGWTFAGYWDTLKADANGNPLGKQYYDKDMKSVRKWDKRTATTLWAKWTVKVTLGKNGGTGGDSYVTVTYGQPFPKRAMPTKSGYNFGGYFVSASSRTGQCYNADGTGTASMAWKTGGTPTVWALWTAKGKSSALYAPARQGAPVDAVAAGTVIAPCQDIYTGTLADGTGEFTLEVDDAGAFVVIESEGGHVAAECAVLDDSDGEIVVVTEDGAVYRLVPDGE